jgi:hypothetical protein
MKIYNELESLEFFEWLSETHNLKDTDMTPEYLDELPLNDIHRTVCNSMAFRFFREKYNINTVISWRDDLLNYDISLTEMKKHGYFYYKDNFNTYEEAELACLQHLIKIVKEKQK